MEEQDDFDAICLRLGIGPEPFSDMIVESGRFAEGMIHRAVDGYRVAAIRGENSVANYIDAVALNAGLGPCEKQRRAPAQELRRELIRLADRLVRRFGLTEVNKRASLAARQNFERRNPMNGLPNGREGFLKALGIEGGMMPETVFFAWQSDVRQNRNFIITALEKAIAEVKRSDGVALDPAPDRDTKGEAGAPEIAGVILKKIQECSVFVADLTLVGDYATARATANPNVVFETGYAVGRKGWKRIVGVVNTAYGRIEDLPFDLRGHRLLGFELREDAREDERREARKNLEARLTGAIRAAVSAIES